MYRLPDLASLFKLGERVFHQGMFHTMRRHYLTMMAAKLGAQAFGHGVRPFAWTACTAIGDRIASTRKKRAP